MAKATPRNPSARKAQTPQARKTAFKRKVSSMVKGGRAIAAQQASNKIAKKANARSIAKVGHRMVGTASAKTSRSSPIKIRQAIKSAAPRTALRTFERSQAHAVKKARVGEKLAGRPERTYARLKRKISVANRDYYARQANLQSLRSSVNHFSKAGLAKKAEANASTAARRARVHSVKASVRNKIPMLRVTDHSGPVARRAAALQIKAHRAANPKAKGIASTAGKGIPHFEGSLSKGKLSLKKAIAPGSSLKGKRVRYLKISRHAGKSSVKHLSTIHH